MSEESDLDVGRERIHIATEFRVGKQKSVKVGNNYEAGNMIILVASFILVYFAERGRTEAPFLVAEVLEVITANYPIRMKVWYYESYKRRNLIYGNGKFSRMNNNNDLDTGVESELSVVCKFKKLCKCGKKPKNVKDIISTHVELNYSFGSNTVSESAKRRNTEHISSDESNELSDSEDSVENSSSEESNDDLEESSQDISNESKNESLIGEKRRKITQEKSKLPKGWVYESDLESKKKNDERQPKQRKKK